MIVTIYIVMKSNMKIEKLVQYSIAAVCVIACLYVATSTYKTAHKKYVASIPGDLISAEQARNINVPSRKIGPAAVEELTQECNRNIKESALDHYNTVVNVETFSTDVINEVTKILESKGYEVKRHQNAYGDLLLIGWNSR